MRQYCRYCIHCIAQGDDTAVCEEKNIMIKKTAIRDACKLFDFCEIDAFYYNRTGNPEDAKYKPRTPVKKQCDGQMTIWEVIQNESNNSDPAMGNIAGNR